MKRVSFKMYLKPDCIEEYKKRHDELWPELKQLLTDEGVYDYSIYFDKETNVLFAVQKVDGNTDSQDLGINPLIQKWWLFMSDLMDTNPDNSPVSMSLNEVFHLD